MKRFFPHLLWIAGLLMLPAAVVFGALTIGVPYPDPTPAQARQEALMSTITTVMVLTGLGLFVIGLGWVIVRCFLSRRAGK